MSLAADASAGTAPLFLDADSAERPVDLRGELEAAAPQLDSTDAIRERLRELRESSAQATEGKLIAELDRGLASRGLQLPPMPQVILRVQRLIDCGDFNMEELAEQVEVDPALVTKLVGIASSPFYAGFAPTRSVRDAIVRIGIRETRNILMAIMLL